MEFLTIDRVLASPRRGSSRPVLVDTSAGQHLVKLRGAAQGTGALVAEVVVAALAKGLSLPVLSPRFVQLTADTPVDDRDEELLDLLAASTGLNLGFPMLEGARDAEVGDYKGFSPEDRAKVLWLDRFVLNLDRTHRNPNVLQHAGRLYLIDHGAALRFQYYWPEVTEQTPRDVGATGEVHIFEDMAASTWWEYIDDECTRLMTRTALEDAVDAVPKEFLVPLLPDVNNSWNAVDRDEAIRRRRAAYVAFLWKRLKPPRAFVTESPVRSVAVSGPPSWLAIN